MTSVKREFASGVFYISLAKYSGLIVQILITSVLARLIPPEDFGILAIATVFIAFLNICADFGISASIIQNKALNEDDYNSLFAYTVVIALLLSMLFFFLSYPIAYFYDNVELQHVCQWLCIMVFFFTINVVPDALLLKKKKFKVVAVRMLSCQIIAGIIAIIFALKGAGVYALVIQTSISTIIIFAINYANNRLYLGFRGMFSSVKKIYKFSLYQFFFNCINYFTRNLDKLMVGKFLGAAQLGYYEKSYRLMMLPLQNITNVLTPVMLPVFSQLQDSLEQVSEKYVKLISILAYVTFPLSIWLFFDSRELILIFFGDQWEQSILPFKILSLSLCVQMINSTTGSVFLSIGNSKGLFYTGVTGAFFIVTSFFITIFHWGTLEAVSVGFDIALFLSALSSFYILFRALCTPLSVVGKAFLKPFLLSILLLILLQIVSSYIDCMNIVWSMIVKLAISVIITTFYVEMFTDYNLIQQSKIFIRKKLLSRINYFNKNDAL